MVIGKINNRYATYSNAGGINGVKSGKALTYYESLKQILNYYGSKSFVKGNLILKHYAFDSRIGKDVYMLTGDFDKYKNQFLTYIIEINEEDIK